MRKLLVVKQGPLNSNVRHSFRQYVGGVVVLMSCKEGQATYQEEVDS